MSKLVIFVACVALFQAATALNCYKCDGDKCTEKSTWEEVPNCGKTASGTHVGACLKQVVMENNKEVTSRKCIIADKNEKDMAHPNYHCNAPAGTELKSCVVCVDDLCNSAPAVSFSFFALSGVLLAYLIPKFLVL